MRLTKELSLNSVFDAALCNINKAGWTLRRRKWSHLLLFTTLDDPFCASSEEKAVEFCRAHSAWAPRLCCCPGRGPGQGTHGDTGTCPPCWRVRGQLAGNVHAVRRTEHCKSPAGINTSSMAEARFALVLAEIHYYEVYYKNIILKLALSDI